MIFKLFGGGSALVENTRAPPPRSTSPASQANSDSTSVPAVVGPVAAVPVSTSLVTPTADAVPGSIQIMADETRTTVSVERRACMKHLR
ncbi:MAG TPA: hypothetical protein VJT72_19490 [Pseudonocardiaceae bacterium]|nr:hypothetical protein [Pseudonocardiaceae bacterium]